MAKTKKTTKHIPSKVKSEWNNSEITEQKSDIKKEVKISQEVAENGEEDNNFDDFLEEL